MIESSKDVLYIVISFCIIWATVFLCWMFYYAGKILKNTSQIIDEFRLKLQTLSESITRIHDKVECISFAMSSLFKGVGTTLKNAAVKKAKSWANKKVDDYGQSAKEAVDKAVTVTADKMRKIAKK